MRISFLSAKPQLQFRRVKLVKKKKRVSLGLHLSSSLPKLQSSSLPSVTASLFIYLVLVHTFLVNQCCSDFKSLICPYPAPPTHFLLPLLCILLLNSSISPGNPRMEEGVYCGRKSPRACSLFLVSLAAWVTRPETPRLLEKGSQWWFFWGWWSERALEGGGSSLGQGPRIRKLLSW